MGGGGGGFGFPHLYGQMLLRHVQTYPRAMDSGIVLVHENVSALRHPQLLCVWRLTSIISMTKKDFTFFKQCTKQLDHIYTYVMCPTVQQRKTLRCSIQQF